MKTLAKNRRVFQVPLLVRSIRTVRSRNRRTLRHMRRGSPKCPVVWLCAGSGHIGGPSQPEQHFTSRRIDAGRRATILADAGTLQTLNLV